jgi:uroporphyrinogen decarboxylase
LFALPLAAAAQNSTLTPKARVDRALKGEDTDRVPFTCWYHFGLEKEPPEKFAAATLDFHRRLRTDLVKVMSDFPYPADSSKVHENPFPAQIRALEMIRDGLRGQAHFIETIFNPWNVAEKLTSKEQVQRMKSDEPRKLLDLLERLGRSEASHARRAVATGASGVFLAIANAEPAVLSREDYERFSEPFDLMVLEAAASAPLNVLHLHGDKVYLDHFTRPKWKGAAINYSQHGTGVRMAGVRARFGGVLLGGVDETAFRKLSTEDLRRQAKEAREGAGKRLILTPGCSVPNETTDAEILRLTQAVESA